jgi:hypothetical protein
MQPDIGKYQTSASDAGAVIMAGEVRPGGVEADETKAFINNLFSEGKYEEAGPHLEAMRKTAEAAKDLGKKAWSLHQMGIRAFCMGDKAGARGFWKESLKIRKSLKDVNGAAVTNYHLRLIRPSLPLSQRVVDRIGEIGARILIPLGVVVTALLFAPVMSNRTAPPQPAVVPSPSPSPTPAQENAGPVTIPVVTPQPLASPSATLSASTPAAASSTSPAPATPAPVAPPPAPAPDARITINPPRVHFTGPGEQVITLTNSGSVAFTNLKVNWVNNPGVFKASLDCADLKAGQQCRLRIGYSGSTAPSSAALNIVYDGGEITMPMGPGSHGMARSPDRLTFADQAVNSTGVTQAVTITNKSTAEVEVREISVPGRIFFRKPHFTASQDCERKIAPGASCAIKVTFAPTEVGIQKTELRIKVRPAGGGEALPLNPVVLIGKGVGK